MKRGRIYHRTLLGIFEYAQWWLHRISRTTSAVEGAAVHFLEIRGRCARDLRRRARENFNSSARFSFCRRRIANHCSSGQKNYVVRNGNHKSGGEMLFENGKWKNLKKL